MKSSPFHKGLLRDKATYQTQGILVSRDAVSWTQTSTFMITAEGTVMALTPAGHVSLLVSELQSCQVQIYPHMAGGAGGRRRFGKKDGDALSPTEEPPVIFLRSYDNVRLYMKIGSKAQFGAMLQTLLAWQNMRPLGLAKKWFAANKFRLAMAATPDPHELLVCRFKVYGPLPTKAKAVKVVPGPLPPLFHESLADISDPNGGSLSLPVAMHFDPAVPEGWFYTMGVLKSNGVLNLITELDGTLLYLIDIKNVLSSEIRELHHSICDAPNILFVGHIKELRWNNVLKSTSALTSDTVNARPLLTRDDRPVAANLRIFIEFPLHIDLEDWFVGLNYFCKREYIGSYTSNSVEAGTPPPASPDTSYGDRDSTLDTSFASSTSQTADMGLLSHGKAKPVVRSELDRYSRDHFRVLKKLTIDIIEAKFDEQPLPAKVKNYIYAEVVMWNFPWARTASVPFNQNPFWKEEFATDLPILTQMIHIVIKRSLSPEHSARDAIVGTVYLTPDVLTHHLVTASTMTIDTGTAGISLQGELSISQALNAVALAPAQSNIVRLSIYDSVNVPIGKLLLTVDLKEYLILPPADFRPLEGMLLNCPMKELIDFCNSTVMTSQFGNVSFILLDIFQSLGIEDRWFKTLIEAELVSVDNATKKNFSSKTSTANSNNVFNTLFRGSSIFTKSLEKYILRIGQEYLEKVFGNFFEKVSLEKKACEIDPRYVRLQEKAKRKFGNNADFVNDDIDEEDVDSDEDYDSDAEKELEDRVQEIVEENFQNLYAYTEEIWEKIFSTSNDLPKQIKSQLKSFRTKVDLACDPDDKQTSLNCLSAFIFLRFFCPAILNPKLFYLTKTHQTGDAQRTLTLIAKVLLNLANRQEFNTHKEPHLLKMNKFLKEHEHEVFEYFDRITGRKNDFNEKVLNLSHEMKRFDLGLGEDSSSSELPTTPYLIDKCLRLTEFIHLLQLNDNRSVSQSRSSKLGTPGSSVSIHSTINLPRSNINSPMSVANNRSTVVNDRDGIVESAMEIQLNEEGNVYQIGSLEFEKSEFLDLVGDNQTEGFIKSLCRSNEDIFSFITSNISLLDLQKQSTNMVNKINDLSQQLQFPELCRNLQGNNKLWELFVHNIIERACLDSNRNLIVFLDPNFQEGLFPGQKRLTEHALASFKLKFPMDYNNGDTILTSESVGSMSTLLRGSSKNPFRRWLKRD